MNNFERNVGTRNTLIAASIAWKVRFCASKGDFFGHVDTLVHQCIERSANLIVFPELFEVELLTGLPDGPESSVPELLAPFAPDLEAHLSALACRHRVTIVGGSHLVQQGAGIFNVSGIFFPDGSMQLQHKNCPTRWELSPWKLSSSTGIQQLKDPRLGVSICYDVEFPESSRAIANNGATVLCVPSYCSNQHGYQRVNWCCRARATENEIFVVHASLVGPIQNFDLGTAYGNSSIICPSKAPFPNSAILAQTELNEEGIAVAEIDFDALAGCRSTGDARPWSDRARSTWQIIPNT